MPSPGVPPAYRDGTAAAVMEGAIDAMADGLDPHTSFLNEQEFRELQVSTRGMFGGLGIEITRDRDAIRVVSPMEGTPAYYAGLKPGDRIVAINGENAIGISKDDVPLKLKGPKGTKVQVTIEREGWSAPKEITLIRDVIIVPSVNFSLLPQSAAPKTR